MTTLKYILFTVVALIALLLVIALFVNSKFQVETKIIINQPKQVVFDYLKHLKNSNEYNKWRQIDPDMKKNYRGKDGTVGFIYAWESKMQNAGVGEQEITAIVEGERIQTEIRFKEPFESTDQSYIITENSNKGYTRVTFGYNGKMKYPINLLIPVFKNKIGSGMKENLQTLKTLLEQK